MLSVDNSHHMMEMKFRPQSIAECILPRHDIERFNGLIKLGDNDDMSAVQKELRSWMEAYGGNCTIIMTCNNIEKIIDPLRSFFFLQSVKKKESKFGIKILLLLWLKRISQTSEPLLQR